MRIVTAGDDATARVWSFVPGDTTIVLAGHAGPVNSAAFSPDGLRVVTAGDDQTARVWNALTGAELLRLAGHIGPVHSAAFSPDGLRIITASDDGLCAIWDADTGAPLLLLLGHAGPARSADYRPDGQRIVTASEDGTVRIWNAATGVEYVPLRRNHEAPLARAVWSPDAQQILAALLAAPPGGLHTDPNQPLLNGEIRVQPKSKTLRSGKILAVTERLHPAHDIPDAAWRRRVLSDWVRP